jgi:hypothetical protein
MPEHSHEHHLPLRVATRALGVLNLTILTGAIGGAFQTSIMNRFAVGAALPAFPLSSSLRLGAGLPTRPVRIIVGFAAGGGSDVIARIVGQWLSDRLGKQFVEPTGRWYEHRHRGCRPGTGRWLSLLIHPT